MATEFTYDELYEDEEGGFRDSIATVDEKGKRIWLYPKKPKGAFYNKRLLATLAFLAIFISGPFTKIGGQPLLMMNIFERKFVIFGRLFLPQDFVLFGLGMITFVVFIALFTATFGRIWCGWLCPQTVFMEMIFRPIENWLEGDGRKQQKFDQKKWDFDKAWRKTLKHAIFIVFSIFIAHITMAYLIGIENVKELITSPPSENWAGFIGLVVFTGAFYFVFAKLREQVCIAICPYGRLQGVLVNKDTVNVMYDNKRGEPRGRISKNATEEELSAQGDCIDCKLCIQVCPTGIDIRNGVQLECVNCTACIDACDEVMEKVNKPKGLIRYASLESVEKGVPFKLPIRSWAYSAVLLLLIGIETAFLMARADIETTVMRVPGQLYQKTDRGTITNLYNAQMVNKSQEEMNLKLALDADISENWTLNVVGANEDGLINLKPEAKTEVVFFIEMPEGDVKQRSTELKLRVLDGEEEVENVKTNFFGPAK
ncbi:cytochrome c oxidase accessory protein CcoG [Jiulongibacter sediminis]|uniref:Cytochrome C oxidase n=1 Tax=Jiulongibacter sediminis TaxID=1605367 RepID=A0A0P7C3F2_9BACT|nr:cytochrome c oxidase accessory protein CcoG [Jiulongibacter sediminis]KPM49165.1 cytochrome C oxidase [Jiulongibacter sediminis]TBX26220.1 cytochrome C oxidase [Jiulongibacter sediminis]